MEQWITTLQKCILFRDLSEEIILQEILPSGRIVEVPCKKELISYQDKVDWFGVILEGKVQVSQFFPDGEHSLMDTLFPPSVVGADLIPTKSRKSPYFAITSEQTKLFRFSSSVIDPMSLISKETRSHISKQLTTLIAHENMRKHYRIAVLSQKGLRARIITYLTMQADRRGSTSFSIRFNREELAAFLCVNRSALSHELSLMTQEGLITVKKNKFTLNQTLINSPK